MKNKFWKKDVLLQVIADLYNKYGSFTKIENNYIEISGAGIALAFSQTDEDENSELNINIPTAHLEIIVHDHNYCKWLGIC